VGFERYAKTTRRAAFLAEMERVVPWLALCGLIEPVYPKVDNGRPPVGVERMLRIYFLQNAPSSTKNAEKARDPEMHQTKKGNQHEFGVGVLLPGGQHGLLIGREGTHPQFLSVVDTLWRMGSRCRQPAAVASISLCANSGGSLR
jgi:hypothetical protein